MWEHCLTQIQEDPLSLDRECDWVIKHRLIEAYRTKHDLPLSHPKVALMDLQYHDVNRARGLFYRMQQKNLVERMCTDADIDTRSTLRPRRREHDCGASSSAGRRSASATTPSTGCI